MLSLEHINLRRGTSLLLEDANFTLHQGQRVGLVGKNGSGKSSLFKLISGELDTDAGQLSRPTDWRLAMMAQEVPALPQPAIDYVLDGHQELRAAERELARAQDNDDSDAMAHAHARLDTLRAWEQPARAATLLAGLGFSEAQQQQPVSAFSGGWRMRLNLAQVLLANAELVLLDEPTNHLDLDAILWLQQWLVQQPGALMVISHDRAFLDATVGEILHIDQGRLRRYTGTYSDFERQRAEQLSQQQKLYEKQQTQIAHLQKFVDRFKAKASKAKQAQSRVKALEKLERIAPAHVDSAFRFSFHTPKRLPDPMIDLEGVGCGYDGQPVLTNVTLNLRPESRLGLLGQNGAGKSTLIRTLVGELPAIGGHLLHGPDLVIGYFHQQQVDRLDARDTPYQLLNREYPQWSEQQIRNELGGFGFHGDEVFAPIGRFSGGEKARLALSLIVQQKPSLLLLDEPANHLDLDMREALTMALQDFAGAVVLVSHDRHLLETTVDEFLLVADGGVRPFDGDLDDYARWLQQARRDEQAEAKADDTRSPVRDDAKQRRQDAARRREQLRPLKKTMEKCEQRLELAGRELAEVEMLLGDEGLYTDSARKQELADLLARQGQLRNEKEEQEMALLEAMEALEEAEKAVNS